MTKAVVLKTRSLRDKTVSLEDMKRAMHETLQEFFENAYDPDEGRELRPEFIKKLKRSIAEAERGEVYEFDPVSKIFSK